MILTEQVPSEFQERIYEAVKKEDTNIVVSATAGSGKTTTIKTSSSFLKRNKSILFLAFNKSIATELRKKLPTYIDVSTLHAMGLRWLRGKELNNNKDFSMIAEIATAREFKKKKDFFRYCYNIVDISNFLRVNYKEPNDVDIREIIMKYTLDYDRNTEVDFQRFWKKREAEKDLIDFTDMLYLPVKHDLVKPHQRYDVIFVDEVQDLNVTQILFLEKLIKPKGRIISVGDQWQAIYGFAGADTESFDKLLNRQNTVKLPLSISYRCSKSIVYNAQLVNPEIMPFEDNAEGEVREAEPDEIRNNDLVICRNNRPLFEVYFNLIRRGIKATVVGSDIEDGLNKLVKHYQKMDYDDLLEKLEEDEVDLINRLIENGYEFPKKSKKYTDFIDKKECIAALVYYAKSKKLTCGIKQLIEIVFTPHQNAVKLMSVHKSKGLEADRVFLIETYEGKRLMPSPYAEQEWEQQQERHLQFVALTRARLSMYFLYL